MLWCSFCFVVGFVMKAIALTRYLPADDPQSLLDLDLPKPVPGALDILVNVQAVSVNPVDAKQRARRRPEDTEPCVLGFDGAGTIAAIGAEVRGFAVGERVYYSGDVTRPGSNAEFQLVDARLAARMPETLDMADAAALPLTAITAWELLFERMGYAFDGGGAGRTLLVIAGAGGMGSITIQLAKLAGFRVIATASRAESMAWCQEMGADAVIDHRQPLTAQLQALGVDVDTLDAAVNFASTDQYWTELGELLAPLGHVGLIVEPAGALRIGDPYKAKSIGIHWEFMPARPRYRTPDMYRHGEILAEVARLIDSGHLRTTRTQTLSPINAMNLRRAHAQMEAGTSIGKLVLAGWA